jgi:enamine deaminase RidA (YjgF/YER057c/UK114 family)
LAGRGLRQLETRSRVSTVVLAGPVIGRLSLPAAVAVSDGRTAVWSRLRRSAKGFHHPRGPSMIKRWSPAEIGPPVGQYSHLASAPADHDIVFLAGQVGADRTGRLVGPDAEAQSRQIFDNIEALLAAAGGTPDHLVKLFTMVAGTEHVAGCRAGRLDHFARWFPAGDWPAQSLIVVSALASPDILVEVEAVAAIPRR